MIKRRKKDPVIILLTGLGINYRFLYPYKMICKFFGWKCEIVKNSEFTTDELDEYSSELARVINKHHSVITIGISLGGLASVNAVANMPELKKKILKSYTICSPVGGANPKFMNSKFIRILMSPKMPRILLLSRSLAGLRKIGKMFDGTDTFTKISKIDNDEEYSVCNYYHDNDYLVLPEQAMLNKSIKKRIKYNYKMIPKIFHHHVSCSDPRIFFEILEEINNNY